MVTRTNWWRSATIHAHPEIGFEEHRTSDIVAKLLEGWGIKVHRGLGGTGVVGELTGKHNGNKRIGLRADYGCAADPRGDRSALCIKISGQDARLRP